MRIRNEPLSQTLPQCHSGTTRLLFFCLAFLAVVVGMGFGEEIDRLIAAVNGVAITEGDLDLARNLNAIVFYGNAVAADSRNEGMERLIDQELMRQELKNFSMTDEKEGEIEARMRSLRDAYSEKGGLPALLNRIGLQESELISYVRLESSIMKFVDFRFRPFISVSTEEVRAYYENRLTLQLQESGIDLPPLGQISGKIEAILKEEKINAALDQWIKEIRRNSRIEYFHDADSSNGSKMQYPRE